MPAALRSLLALVVLAGVAGTASGQSGLLEVHVREAGSSRPLTGATVLVDDDAARGITDSAGVWRGRVAPGEKRVVVRLVGYRPQEQTVDLPSGAATPLNIRLVPAIVPLGAVVVTAARREQQLADAVVTTELYTRDELERGGATDLASALIDRAGVQLDGGVPAGAGVQMRGFDSRRVLVLVDGQPMAGRINGNFDLSRLPLAGVDRVEIVKGPQSTLYGSDAMGGVINVITRPAPTSGGEADLSTLMGSQGRREASGSGGWRTGALGATVDAGIRRISLAPGVAGDDGTFAHRWNGQAKVRYEADSHRSLEGAMLAVGEHQRFRAGQLFYFADNTQLDGRLSAASRIGLQRLSATVSLSSFDHLSRASTLSEPVSDSGARDRQRLIQGEVLWNGLVGGVLADLGYTVRHESIDADRVVAPGTGLTTAEPFGQLTFSWRGVSVSPGARVTWSDRWGRFVAPQFAALYRPTGALALRASVGRGFRAPDFKELYLHFVNDAVGYSVIGNPALRPERSFTTSLGAEWTTARLYGRATAFWNSYRDFIETGAPDASFTYTYDNIARGSTQGIDLEGGVLAGAWRVDATSELLRTRDASTDTPLLGRPGVTARLGLSGPAWLGVQGGLNAVYTGRTAVTRDPDGTIARERGGFLRLDARLEREMPFGVELVAGMTNLLNRQVGADWPAFTGRQVFVEARLRHAPAGGR